MFVTSRGSETQKLHGLSKGREERAGREIAVGIARLVRLVIPLLIVTNLIDDDRAGQDQDVIFIG